MERLTTGSLTDHPPATINQLVSPLRGSEPRLPGASQGHGIRYGRTERRDEADQASGQRRGSPARTGRAALVREPSRWARSYGSHQRSPTSHHPRRACPRGHTRFRRRRWLPRLSRPFERQQYPQEPPLTRDWELGSGFRCG